jgi:hypothetical protein
MFGAMWLVAAPQSEGPDQSVSIPTRQTAFSIPFRVDPSTDPAGAPIEVELLVSTDGGARWQTAQTVPVSKGQFVFRAASDGDYWFAMRSRDRSGQVHPSRVQAPGLRVIVDRTVPILKIQAVQDQSGQIHAQWQVIELHPDPKTLSIQYRAGESGSWQDVPAESDVIEDAGSVRTGRVSWLPQLVEGSGRVEIRAEMADTAGNRAVAHAQVAVQPPATENQPTSPDASVSNSAYDGATAESGDTDWRSSSEASANSSYFQNESFGEETTVPASEPDNSLDDTDIYAETPGSPTPSFKTASHINPPLANEYVPPQHSDPDPETQGPTAGKPIRVVSSQEFAVEYELDPTTYVSQVELWCSSDGGSTWTSIAVDDDTNSPMLATVSDEGIYGFRISATSGPGDQQPQSGQLPQFWVAVDLTRPLAKIVSAEMETGNLAGNLVIRWTAEDTNLQDRPVSILYQTSQDAPWSVVASDLENTGQYAWPVDSEVTGPILLRLEVRDKAGNLGVDEIEQTISPMGSRPTAQIRDIHAVRSEDATFGAAEPLSE